MQVTKVEEIKGDVCVLGVYRDRPFNLTLGLTLQKFLSVSLSCYF